MTVAIGFYQASQVFGIAHKCGGGPQEEWEMEGVH